MPTEDLFPCPFCGGEPRVMHCGAATYMIQCVGCKATTDDGSLNRIADLWNSRATSRETSVELPAEVMELVCAAREFWDDNNDSSQESRALDAALEAFASRVRYANEPDELEVGAASPRSSVSPPSALMPAEVDGNHQPGQCDQGVDVHSGSFRKANFGQDSGEQLLRVSPSSLGVPIELDGISRALADKDGFWKSCSGCHELNEGVPTGPFSSLMKCHLGMGCSECGGIGAIWDRTDYKEMGRYLAGAPEVRIAFGLEAQSHIPAVEAALAEGADWQEIGRLIGWDGETAKAYYERHLARLATTEGQP